MRKALATSSPPPDGWSTTRPRPWGSATNCPPSGLPRTYRTEASRSMGRKQVVGFAAACLIGALTVAPAAAQTYPARPITLVVPYPAGGGVDAMARMVGQKLSIALEQQVVVKNRGGGNGNVGTRSVAKAAADGYTPLLGYSRTPTSNTAQ